MIKTCIIGASGYAGADLANIIQHHPEFELAALYVSANSADAGKLLGDIHPKWFNQITLPLTPIDESNLGSLANNFDLIFLATPHEASHVWMPELTSGKAVIMDLSGAFRIKNKDVFEQFYGFAHTASDLLSQAVYGLADWHQEQIKQADLVAVPGCYPTASLTALKPLQQNGFLESAHLPIINAVSGVSGAGRKAALGTSFTEVSLTAYGVLGHRHQPEISEYLGAPVIFTPHLGNFKRGILATITVKLQDGVTAEQISAAYESSYTNNPIVRLRNTWPKIDDVANTPFCDLFWKFDPESGYLVVTSAIDNLLKGAASQAVQCANLRFGFDSHLGLVASKLQKGLVN
ncbi:N-acetyl-gamma-glutamyl-phosphate reductase [Paraglaciecola aquimarina]|uniref:N-acetyl-gamma-glutamyl-phosphate reductase n=1 Tax=Paraglaciecola algarum TaxID=3050085 RepID=A0ABS9DCG9_9ALTE|nr:N-acetyl-gamma-glutamyl-phosphate reductase [Paraglaciecola sp. G1-23]MCF2949331.1 N-acetyl-gamma-glutamyl-phosphate reductase [Paraglaciecola sp. G1-23]